MSSSEASVFFSVEQCMAVKTYGFRSCAVLLTNEPVQI